MFQKFFSNICANQYSYIIIESYQIYCNSEIVRSRMNLGISNNNYIYMYIYIFFIYFQFYIDLFILVYITADPAQFLKKIHNSYNRL